MAHKLLSMLSKLSHVNQCYREKVQHFIHVIVENIKFRSVYRQLPCSDVVHPWTSVEISEKVRRTWMKNVNPGFILFS